MNSLASQCSLPFPHRLAKPKNYRLLPLFNCENPRADKYNYQDNHQNTNDRETALERFTQCGCASVLRRERRFRKVLRCFRLVRAPARTQKFGGIRFRGMRMTFMIMGRSMRMRMFMTMMMVVVVAMIVIMPMRIMRLFRHNYLPSGL